MKNSNIFTAYCVAVTLLGSALAKATLTVTDFSNGGNGAAYTASGIGNQVIPDNTPVGASYAFNFGDSGLAIGNLSVGINISGGYNGDLYAYLSHGSTLVQLLNPNSAVSGSGMNITLVEGVGDYLPMGGSGMLGGAGGATFTAYHNLAAFNGIDANGTWTLFFADLSPGDASTLTGFTVSLTAVPEPVNVALGAFAGMLFLASVVRQVRRNRTTKLLG